MFVRFTAAALIGMSLLELGLYAGECHVHQQPVQVLHGLFLLLPLILGIAVLARARAVAEWISNKFDE